MLLKAKLLNHPVDKMLSHKVQEEWKAMFTWVYYLFITSATLVIGKDKFTLKDLAQKKSLTPLAALGISNSYISLTPGSGWSISPAW